MGGVRFYLNSHEFKKISELKFIYVSFSFEKNFNQSLICKKNLSSSFKVTVPQTQVGVVYPVIFGSNGAVCARLEVDGFLYRKPLVSGVGLTTYAG